MTKKTASAGGLKIIHAGLFPTGTVSMTQAYRILGYRTHHALDDVQSEPWPLIEEAAEATWPEVPKARPRRPYRRKDWDAVWGSSWDIVTDTASPFAEQLVVAYPKAKVVILQRDFDAWWPSFKIELLDGLFLPGRPILAFVLHHVLSVSAVRAMTKVHFGFFGARTQEEIYEHAREAYEGYYKRIRMLVPKERRLEYQLGSGWEPLCAFLGKDVPNVEFPWVHDRTTHAAGTTKRRQKAIMEGVWKFLMGLLESIATIAVVVVAVWIMWAGATTSTVLIGRYRKYE